MKRIGIVFLLFAIALLAAPRPAVAQNYTTDTYVHGLQHPMSLVHEIAEFIKGKGHAGVAERAACG